MDRQLQRLYAENQFPVAFVDESYELHRGKTFYILATALVYPKYLSDTRESLLEAYGAEALHAAPMFKRMEFGSLRSAIDLAAGKHDGMDVVVHAPVDKEDHRGQEARRRCLEFIVPLLHDSEDVSLFVLDALDNPVANRRDSLVFTDLRRAGVVPRTVRAHHAFPAEEPLLGLPDVLAWSFRQWLSRGDASWFDPLRNRTVVHDIA